MNTFLKKLSGYAPYLDEVRKKLFIVAICFVVFFAIGFFSTAPIFRVAVKLFHIENVTIITVSPFQFIDLAMNTGFALAFIGCLPVLIYQIFSFLRTGLTVKEKMRFFFSLPLVLFLFICGFCYGAFTLYFAFSAIAQINLSVGMQNYWDISKLISQIFLTSALLGLIFQFPLVITYLVRAGILNIQYLKAKRKNAVALIFIGTSLLPPTDGVSLIIMVLPLLLMYELTILANDRQIIY
jgi:sec-independent protein translocase protein TatC